MKIRKQDYQLTLDDLDMYPAWEYALDEEGIIGQDERTVRPYIKAPPLDPHDAYFIVRAEFILSNGSTLAGHITPRTKKTEFLDSLIPYDLRPVILTIYGTVHFCYGSKQPPPKMLSHNYEILELPAESVFPIHFRSVVDIINGIAEGTLDGFLYFNSTEIFNLSEKDQKTIR